MPVQYIFAAAAGVQKKEGLNAIKDVAFFLNLLSNKVSNRGIYPVHLMMQLGVSLSSRSRSCE